MDIHQRVLFINPATGFYRLQRYSIDDFFGPVDLGLHLSGKYNSLNIGIGLLAGSVFPGSNRLIFTGFSPCWGGFYISSMGGAGLVFDNLGLNMISLIGKAPSPSLLYLNRTHGEEIQVECIPIDIQSIWNQERGGVYALMDYALKRFGEQYENDPRVLCVGPASSATDFGAVCSSPIVNGKLTSVDTWSGRGGFGTKMLLEHGIACIIYGGSYLDEDFRDRKIADQWFEQKYNKKLLAKDLEATTKYRFDPKFETGGTFGVNFASVKERMIAFNYRSIYLDEQERSAIHKRFIIDHYLRQFNEETINTKQQKTCGEPCMAVCKKMNGIYKKDYEPYQALGPLCGIFDQRAAEALNHHADRYGFDAISIGGVVSWLMECLDRDLIEPKELGVDDKPVFKHQEFSLEADSKHNADLGKKLLDNIIQPAGVLDLSEGARKLARRLARAKGQDIMDCLLFVGFARKGWMVPNQYWVPGVISPMPIMGKYYMHYGNEFLPPRELGKLNARRMKAELIMDNLGICRFHRAWAEEMLPDIVGSLYNKKEEFVNKIAMTASRINSRNSSVFWESQRCIDFIYTYLKRKHEVEGDTSNELVRWLDLFKADAREAALNFWYEMHKGAHESLREF